MENIHETLVRAVGGEVPVGYGHLIERAAEALTAREHHIARNLMDDLDAEDLAEAGLSVPAEEEDVAETMDDGLSVNSKLDALIGAVTELTGTVNSAIRQLGGTLRR